MEIPVPVGCNGIFSPWNRMRTLNSTGFSLGFRGVAGPRLTLEKFGTQDPHQKERDLPAIGPGPAQSAFLAKPHLFITADRAPVGRKHPEVDAGEPQRRKSVADQGAHRVGAEIGRASGRERGEVPGAAAAQREKGRRTWGE